MTHRGPRLAPALGVRAFTLLEMALIVAIIGMMLMMIVGYLLAPKQTGPLPPVAPAPLIPPSAPVAAPAPKPAPSAPAKPATPIPPSATPTQTIELSPQSAPVFR